MTAEEQAVVLVNEVRAEREQEIWKGVGDRRGYGIVLEALCRAIERHEAFKQEVSDVMTYIKALYPTLPRNFNRFIIPKPKSDPLAEVLADFGGFMPDAEDFRTALEARGLEIREKSK
jgi:regulator of protease activity HflC (stomatin/prohibitin superfamily)